MQEELIVSVVQTPLVWESVNANIEQMNVWINAIDKTDLIVLPETFSTGFSMQVEQLAEEKDGPTFQWMMTTATSKNAVVTGSCIIKEEGNYYNRLFWCYPDGNYLAYNKRHLFTMGNEHLYFTAGNEKIFPEYKGWRFCPLICYDLRFPVWSRNVSPFYDVLIYVANWPEVRSVHWKTLLTARAMENQSYVVAVNRVEQDGNGVNHCGDSGIINPKGEWLVDCANQAQVKSFAISAKELKEFREKFPVLLDADAFKLVK